jgi:hypothetical protein
MSNSSCSTDICTNARRARHCFYPKNGSSDIKFRYYIGILAFMGDAEQLHICRYNQTISAYYPNKQAQQLPFLGL